MPMPNDSARPGSLVFDYRNFGDSEGQPRQLLDIGMQLADWAAAVDYARTLEDIDHNESACGEPLLEVDT